jgi:hypothetical protein
MNLADGPKAGLSKDLPEPAAWPEAGSEPERASGRPEPEAGPQAITARDPRQRTAYPWQKSARPETTN